MKWLISNDVTVAISTLDLLAILITSGMVEFRPNLSDCLTAYGNDETLTEEEKLC